jgi:hypothetical protein
VSILLILSEGAVRCFGDIQPARIKSQLLGRREYPPIPLILASASNADGVYLRGRTQHIRLGDLHCFRDFANFLSSEQWLNSLNITFLRQTNSADFSGPATCLLQRGR